MKERKNVLRELEEMVFYILSNIRGTREVDMFSF